MYNYQALLEQLAPEDFVELPKSKSSELKSRAAIYLGLDQNERITPTDLRRLRAKANKMKKSRSKAVRAQGARLNKKLSQHNNS